MQGLLRDYRLWLILLLAVATRCWHLAYRSLSGDEGYSLMLSQFPAGDILEFTARDVHPPLYYLMLHGWLALVGHSVAGVRALSVVAGVVTVLIQALLLQLLVGRRAALLAALLLAIAPFLVRYSQDVRMYGWLALWVWGATLVLVLWLRSPDRWPWLLLYTALMTAALYTHYFAGLTVLSHWVYLLWLRVRRGYAAVQALTWWAASAMIVVLFLPWVPSLLAQLQHSGQAVWWLPPVSAATVPQLIWTFCAATGAVSLPTWLWLAWPLLLAAVGMLMVARERVSLEPAALLCAALVVPMAAAGLISLKLPVLYPRYLIYAAGALPLLFAAAVDRGLARFKVAVRVALAVWVSVAAAGLFHVWWAEERIDVDSQPDGRTEHLAALLNARFRPGDEVLTVSTYDYSRVFFYLRPELPIRLVVLDAPPAFQGSEALFHHDPDLTMVASLAQVSGLVCRLWWLGVGDDGNQPIEGQPQWQQQERLQTGVLSAWLYTRRPPDSTCAGAP